MPPTLPPSRRANSAVTRALAAAFCLAALSAQPAAAQPYTSGYVQVAVGAAHSCALRHDGQVWCWGANNLGQLGNGGIIGSVAPVQPSTTTPGFGASNIAQIGAHYFGNCALNNAGRAFCWGQNFYGEVGDGTTETRRTPVRVNVLGPGVQVLSTGTYSTCAIDAGSRAWCWGRNSERQLGDGTQIQREEPTPVDTGTPGFGQGNIDTIATGGNHSCAINAAGRAFCWGSGTSGQLGTGGIGNSLVPVGVSTATAGFGIRNISQIAVSLNHTCARNLAGRLFCWGRNDSGQTGTGLAVFSLFLPTPTDTSASGFGVRNIADVTLGTTYGCALNNAGRAYCWGNNGSGQLGNGTPTDSFVPVQVSGLGNGLRAVSAKLNHSCAIDAAGDVWCWGRNDAGQLGDGTTTGSAVPVRVVGLP